MSCNISAHFAFRDPVPAYKHSAAQFLKLRGWISCDDTHPQSPTRPASDIPILQNILAQLEAFILSNLQTSCPTPASPNSAHPNNSAEHIQSLGIKLDFDSELQSAPASPLAQPYQLSTFNLQLSNRWCILPMEGWDATTDGKPTELVTRRWERFGQSGAKLIWGGEAVAVRPDGRANPNQLIINEANLPDIAKLREKS